MAEIEVNAGASPEVIVEDVNEQVIVEGSGELIVTGTPVVTYVPEPFTPESSPWVVNGAMTVVGDMAANNGVVLGGGGTIVTGLVEWDGSNFRGYDGSAWRSLDHSPGGSDTQLQYNNAGVFGGMVGVTWDGTKLVIGSGQVISSPGSGGALTEQFGVDADAAGEEANAFGSDARALGKHSSSYGHGSRATGISTSAYGHTSSASGTAATSLGALANATGNNSLAAGYSALAYGQQGTAIGRSAQVQAGKTEGVAVGYASVVGHAYGVSIGARAVTTADNRCTIGTIGGSWDKELQIGLGFAAWGGTPPSVQPSKISDPSGGTTIDTEARTAINAIIDVLEGAGLSTP